MFSQLQCMPCLQFIFQLLFEASLVVNEYASNPQSPYRRPSSSDAWVSTMEIQLLKAATCLQGSETSGGKFLMIIIIFDRPYFVQSNPSF